MKKSIFYFLMLLAISIGGCQKNDIAPPVDGGNTNPPPVLPEGVAIKTSVFGRIVNEKDEPLNGVNVSGGGLAAVTDVNGVFILKDVMLDQARAYITATKTGYFKGSRIFQPVKDGMSRPPLIKMLPQKSIGFINAVAGGAVQTTGGTKIELPANAIENYSGQVNVVTSYINPTRPDFFARMPGDLAADNAQNKRGALISYGMSHIDLLDDKGNKVKIKAGMHATVTLPVPPALQTAATPNIAMWYFDEVKGLWKEEGSGTYQSGKYVGKVSHFSVWNYDHWNPLGVLPMILRWMLANLSSMPPDDQDAVLNHPPDFLLTVKDKKTKNTLYSNIFPPPVATTNSNPREARSNATFQVPTVTDVMEVTVTPVQPGGPDYPTASNYSATGDDDPIPSPVPPIFATEQESVTVEVRPTNPATTITVTIPPQGGGGGGNGETVVNVNGKAVNCNNTPVTTGYVFMSMRSGNNIVKTTTAPIYGTEGRFTAQHIFYNALQNRVDNVVLTVYDIANGQKSQDIKINVNPSVAHMIQAPVAVCNASSGGGTGGTAKIYNGNYTISNANTLKAFIDSAYTEVNGILYVSNIGDLGGIIKLKKVWGLELRRTTVTGLGGLAELEDMSWLTLVENGQLVNAAFPKLGNKSMQGIHISTNNSLVGLTLPSIESVSPLGNDYIAITSNPVLKTLSIPNLKSVDKCGYIEITSSLLDNLNTFANATGTLGSWGLTLNDNPSLTSVNGLKNIVIPARLTIDQCTSLTTLNGINIPVDMQDYVTIKRNDALTDITAVSSKLKSTGGLTISSNKLLQAASFPAYEQGSISCKDNGALASLSFPKFKQAASVDINHNVKLATINMNVLETITNTFDLRGGLETTQALTAFDLPALKSSGRLIIENCPAITNLDGFASLQTIATDLTISNAYIPGADVKLKTINGFNSLTKVTYSCNLETAAGSGYNGPLTSIKGFKSLKTVGAVFNIGGSSLTDISGFANLESIGQDFRIVKTALTGVDGFAKLASAGLNENRAMNIQGNSKLTSLKGFAALANIASIYFTGNAALTSLDGLEKIKSIKYGIQIDTHPKLTNIDGLANVEGATTGISIIDNALLKSLCGITKLVKGGGNTGVYRLSGNGYNPTVDEIKAGSCSK